MKIIVLIGVLTLFLFGCATTSIQPVAVEAPASHSPTNQGTAGSAGPVL